MITDRIIQSKGKPNNTNDLWLDLNDGVLKYYFAGEWKPVAGSSSDGSGSGGGSGSSFPGVMTVTGQFINDEFSPDEGQPTINEAYNLFKAGGTVILHESFGAEGEAFSKAVIAFSGIAKGGGTQISIFIDSRGLEATRVWTEIQDGDGGGAGILA